MALTVAAGLALGGSAAASSGPSLIYDGAALAGTTVTSPGTVQVDAPGATKVTWVLDGSYLGADESAPFQLSLSVTDGDHGLKARIHEADGSRIRVEAEFRAPGGLDRVWLPDPPAGVDRQRRRL